MGELRCDGTPVKLQPQPAKLLALLVSHAGEVVTREDLAKHVWGSETFVDFDKGLTFAIRQIRTALEDDIDNPRFLETLPKRGYRFIAPVIRPVASHAGISTPATIPPERTRYPVFRKGVAAVAAAIVVALGLTILWRHLAAPKSNGAGGAIASIAVLPLRNLSRDSDQEYFSDGMTDELITDLAKVGRLRVISHTSVQRYKESKESLPEIAREFGVDAGQPKTQRSKLPRWLRLLESRSARLDFLDSLFTPLREVEALGVESSGDIGFRFCS